MRIKLMWCFKKCFHEKQTVDYTIKLGREGSKLDNKPSLSGLVWWLHKPHSQLWISMTSEARTFALLDYSSWAHSFTRGGQGTIPFLSICRQISLRMSGESPSRVEADSSYWKSHDHGIDKRIKDLRVEHSQHLLQILSKKFNNYEFMFSIPYFHRLEQYKYAINWWNLFEWDIVFD